MAKQTSNSRDPEHISGPAVEWEPFILPGLILLVVIGMVMWLCGG